MRPSRILAAALVLCIAAQSAAHAQTCNLVGCTIQISNTIRLNTVAKLTITSTSTTLTPPRAADFGASAGVTSVGPTITVLSNGGYALTASANSTWSGPAGTSKPSSDLNLSVNNGGLTALGQIAHPTTGTPQVGTPYAIGYNVKYNWTVDAPGAYSLKIDFTLTAP